MLKKTLLSAAMLLALTACGDKLTGEKQANAAEEAYRQMAQYSDVVMSRSLATSPIFNKVSFSVDDYQKGAQEATATRKMTLDLNPIYFDGHFEKPIVVTLKDYINYADALEKEKKIARVETTFDVDNALFTEIGLTPEETKEVKELISHFRANTDFYQDDKTVQSFEITPISIENKGEGIQYQGFHLTGEYNRKELNADKLLIASTGSFDSAQLTIKDNEETIILNPFKGDMKVDKDGNVASKTTPIEINYSGRFQSGKFVIENIEFNGTKLSYDNTINNFLGEQRISANNIKIEGSGLPQSVEFDSLNANINTQKKGELYNTQTEFSAKPRTDFLEVFGHIPNLKINEIKFIFTFNNASADAIRAVNTLQFALNPQARTIVDSTVLENMDQIVVAGLSDIVKNKSDLTLDLAVDTQSGKATAKAHLALDKEATIDKAQIENALANDNIEMLMELFAQNGVAIADIVIPESLVQATGMAPMAEQMAGPYVKKENGNYIVHLEYNKGHATINGLPL
ncbi:DUF945 family protein [Suttonella ornithocola]|uniref:Lipoprotein n=1 Tax=Suttonella ornithocola TaxID=279832 RepID=A0A380MTF9_9GAMM|nr:DUF945 family protein [Suttonella ornithocola]SUO95845.1 Uncharacterised protein [Suttonella ornithocola]